MNIKDVNDFQSAIDAGHDLSGVVKNILPNGEYSKRADFIIDSTKPGVITYCPGGIDPATGQCRNNGIAIPDPLGHLASALLLHDNL